MPRMGRKRRRDGEPVGACLAMFVERSGLGPSDGTGREGDVERERQCRCGDRRALRSAGFETGWTQIRSAPMRSGVDYRRIRVVNGQKTDRAGIGDHADTRHG